MKFALTAVLLAFFSTINASPDPRYVCSFCLIALGVVQEAFFQVHLERALASKCPLDSLICQRAVKELILSIEAKAVPEDICKEISLCTQDCKLWSQWPVDPLPPAPPAWPIERKLLSTSQFSDDKPLIKENIMDLDIPRKLDILKPIFEEFLPTFLPETWGMWEHVSFGLAGLHYLMKVGNNGTLEEFSMKGTSSIDPCGYNITCHIQHLIDHKPLQDSDGDYYSMEGVRRLRGNDWRGIDCDDLHGDVYPGRRNTIYNANIDHNCNGISGSNTTHIYEDIFCKNSEQRGLVILGDSATAHFHIPPQWLTADNWNLDQFLPDIENEIDQPHCSWGTGHVTPELCPYQYPIPGIEGVVTSLYTQLRARNRCNHNDFQNIGVNGARITSSMQLVKAMARDQQNDHPLLVWLALIGNDICNGHPTFDTMTEPDEFYEKAMETLNALDNVVPAGSYVVALRLFNGELLYDTMHNHVHPIGTKYQQAYDFMNCLEENPCWGWLNSNDTVRRISSLKADSLNAVYAVSYSFYFLCIILFNL
jgi:hypothetical protein